MSCHSILEHDEIKLLHELGHEVFPAGAYIDPSKPHDYMRPPIPDIVVDPELIEQYGKLADPGVDARDCLTKEFVNNFDTVIIMHLPRWIIGNWEAIKHKNVIWRTIGQSIDQTEFSLKPYRDQGLKIVRYSPMERNLLNYIGEDAIIRFYKDPDEYGPWTGEIKQVITFGQSMMRRDGACNFTAFERATRSFPRHLFGKGNENSVPWATGMVSFEQLQHEMCANRVYFYTGTKPASYTLNFMEAWITAIPVVALGPKHGNMPGYNLYEIHRLIENGVNGFVSDDIKELQSYIKLLFDDKMVAEDISTQARRTAIATFGKQKALESWQEFLDV
jgi:hypothetical protein